MALPSTELGVNGEGLVGLLHGLGGVVVLERQPRQQFLGLHQFGVRRQRLVRQIGGHAFEILRGHQGQAQQGAGVVLLQLERFVEEGQGIGRLGVIQVQPAPAHPVIGILGIPGHQRTERVVGFLEAARFPERLGLLQRLRRQKRRQQQRKHGDFVGQDTSCGGLATRQLRR